MTLHIKRYLLVNVPQDQHVAELEFFARAIELVFKHKLLFYKVTVPRTINIKHHYTTLLYGGGQVPLSPLQIFFHF